MFFGEKMGASNLDELARKYGFESDGEMRLLTYLIDLTDPETVRNFTNWSKTDETKAGLIKLIRNADLPAYIRHDPRYSNKDQSVFFEGGYDDDSE